MVQRQLKFEKVLPYIIHNHYGEFLCDFFLCPFIHSNTVLSASSAPAAAGICMDSIGTIRSQSPLLSALQAQFP